MSARRARMVSRYALHAEIASGGMATVHLGTLVGPVGFARTVAIKRLHPMFAKDPEFVASFLDEARLASRIRHPNVVSTLDVVANDGELFVVMDYILGESLAHLLRLAHLKKARVPVPIATAIMVGVLHGLHAAHEASDERGEPLRIVHRDVSPHNILVGADGASHVIDFGIAKARGRAQVTREGQIKGKLSYMPPEQLLGTPIDRRADVFAASIVFWETLTGRRLFHGVDDGDVLARVLHGHVEAPSAHAPEVSRFLDTVILRGLARDRTKRYSTARELALAIEAASPLAPPSQVGGWVESLAHEGLAERSMQVAQVERAACTCDATNDLSAATMSCLERDTSSLADRLPTDFAPARSAGRMDWAMATIANGSILPLSTRDGVPSRSGVQERTAIARKSFTGVGEGARLGLVAAISIALVTVSVVGAIRLHSRRSARVDETRQSAVSTEVTPPAPKVQPLSPALPMAGALATPTRSADETPGEPRGHNNHRSIRQAPAAQPLALARTRESTNQQTGDPGVLATRPAASAGPTVPGCDPPFWYDAQGNKMYYRHCAGL